MWLFKPLPPSFCVFVDCYDAQAVKVEHDTVTQGPFMLDFYLSINQLHTASVVMSKGLVTFHTIIHVLDVFA